MNMREFIKIVEEANSSSKLDRSVLLYMDPKEPKDKFAQCSSCAHFMPESQRCTLFEKNDKVIANASCNLYAHGDPSDEQEILGSITPKAAGYVTGQVRCENCSWMNSNNTCGLFQELNKLKDIFDLDTKIDPKGCCNGFQK